MITTITVLLILILSLGDVRQPPGATQGQSKRDEAPTVNFCEMVSHPSAYFNRPIRIAATMEIGKEGSTLNNQNCPRGRDNRIGVGFVEPARQDKSLSKSWDRIRNGDWDVHPHVVAVGILRNKSRRDFESYLYRFDLIRLDNIRR